MERAASVAKQAIDIGIKVKIGILMLDQEQIFETIKRDGQLRYLKRPEVLYLLMPADPVLVSGKDMM